jgi:hypothetical protein
MAHLPEFPPKRIVGNFRPAFIEERLLGLHQWLVALVRVAREGAGAAGAESMLNDPKLLEFLEYSTHGPRRRMTLAELDEEEEEAKLRRSSTAAAQQNPAMPIYCARIVSFRETSELEGDDVHTEFRIKVTVSSKPPRAVRALFMSTLRALRAQPSPTLAGRQRADSPS